MSSFLTPISSLESQLQSSVPTLPGTVSAAENLGVLSGNGLPGQSTAASVTSAVGSAKSAVSGGLSLLFDPLGQQVAIIVGLILLVAGIFAFRGTRDLVVKSAKKVKEGAVVAASVA